MRAIKILLMSSMSLIFAPAVMATDIPQFDFEDSGLPTQGDLVIFAGDEGLSGTAAQLDLVLGGDLSAALAKHEFSAKFGKSLSFKALAPFDTITVLGLGDEPLTQRTLIDLGGHAATQADGSATLIADALGTDIEAAGAYIAKGFALGRYNFDTYKQKDQDKGDNTPVVITVHSSDSDDVSSLYNSDLTHVVEGIYLARDLGMEPGNVIYPQSFIDRIKPHFKGVKNTSIKVLDMKTMERMGMGAITGSGRGSINDPRMVAIYYKGNPNGGQPLALVGKGITFDTGGISLKSNTNMWYMKSDLSGAAAVVGTMIAAAKREEKINLVGVLALSENMPSADAIRPGDVLTTMGGKTIEVGSTDAEGRLVLADAVQYTQQEYDPYMMLDIATLTGSAGSALGDDYGAVLTRDWELSIEMMDIGKLAGEDVWPLPLDDHHFDQLKSHIADIKSTAGRPGASVGAAVIGTFIDEDLPWIHLDIAGVDWMDSARPTIPKGHAGWGVRFMDELVRREAAKSN